MQVLLLIIHVLAAVGLVVFVLLQHGKGADAGAAFGSGASSTVFGARGSANFLTRTTAILATIFFATSLSLAYFSGQAARSSGSVTDISVPVTSETREVPPVERGRDVPVVPE